ncbi:hypothetical protein C8Q70DRAFT_971984 [Cubamyces menziesii]|nr:hypothetical protein C8Q70DRAFT_971984 [Cubamyces menziesii]
MEPGSAGLFVASALALVLYSAPRCRWRAEGATQHETVQASTHKGRREVCRSLRVLMRFSRRPWTEPQHRDNSTCVDSRAIRHCGNYIVRARTQQSVSTVYLLAYLKALQMVRGVASTTCFFCAVKCYYHPGALIVGGTDIPNATFVLRGIQFPHEFTNLSSTLSAPHPR